MITPLEGGVTTFLDNTSFFLNYDLFRSIFMQFIDFIYIKIQKEDKSSSIHISDFINNVLKLYIVKKLSPFGTQFNFTVKDLIIGQKYVMDFHKH